MSVDSPISEPIFECPPPDGATSIRIRLRLTRPGNQPSISCNTLTEEAVQNAIDASTVFGKTLRAWDASRQLGPKPWVIPADLVYVGSDGRDIDAPRRIEVAYFGPDKDEAQTTAATAVSPESLYATVARSIGDAIAAAAPAIGQAASAAAKEASGPALATIDLAKKMLDEVQAARQAETKRVDQAISQNAHWANLNRQESGSETSGLVDGIMKYAVGAIGAKLLN